MAKLLTPEETEQALGLKRSALYQRRKAGLIYAVNVGGDGNGARLRYPAHEVARHGRNPRELSPLVWWHGLSEDQRTAMRGPDYNPSSVEWQLERWGEVLWEPLTETTRRMRDYALWSETSDS